MGTTDYRKLCQELFGTDDVQQLRAIAKKVNKPNPRHAGRRKKFSDYDIEKMEQLMAGGVAINEIAERFQTTRQTVSRYLNRPISPGCTMRLTYCYQHAPCTIIDVDFLSEKVSIQNRTDDMLRRAFGVNENPTWEDFELFLQERCFPKSRGLIKEQLRDLGLSDYDPLQIIEKTGGRTAEDHMWIKVQYQTRNEVRA